MDLFYAIRMIKAALPELFMSHGITDMLEKKPLKKYINKTFAWKNTWQSYKKAINIFQPVSILVNMLKTAFLQN